MLGQAKLIGIGIVVVLLLSAIGGAVWYFKWSQTEMKILNEKVNDLEYAIEESEAAVKSLKVDAAKISKNYIFVNNEYEAARKENNALRTKLSRHNIGYLASKKPGLVEKVLNEGTADAERCFEILSGAELTESEMSATKKSQSNTFCPGVANPNYTVNP